MGIDRRGLNASRPAMPTADGGVRFARGSHAAILRTSSLGDQKPADVRRLPSNGRAFQALLPDG